MWAEAHHSRKPFAHFQLTSQSTISLPWMTMMPLQMSFQSHNRKFACTSFHIGGFIFVRYGHKTWYFICCIFLVLLIIDFISSASLVLYSITITLIGEERAGVCEPRQANLCLWAIQRGQGSGFLSEGSSWLTAYMSEQRRFWFAWGIRLHSFTRKRWRSASRLCCGRNGPTRHIPDVLDAAKVGWHCWPFQTLFCWRKASTILALCGLVLSSWNVELFKPKRQRKGNTWGCKTSSIYCWQFRIPGMTERSMCLSAITPAQTITLPSL